ncbi:hypothetical protein SK128_003833 [Halocaridina rubra]|uniref:Nuclear pore membrane glycoprotein 210 n=1 Tax=Halocaridina rubra TaxID=373956 RepID=A0AAN8WWV4_HALRR
MLVSSVYQVLKPEGEIGELVVSVRIISYGTGVSDNVQQHTLPNLKASLPVRFVEDAILQPSSAVLYRHKANILDLVISGGSGFFEVQMPTSEVLSMAYSEKDKKVAVRPLSDGEVKVTLIDVCLDAENPAGAIVRVSSIASLELVVVDRVELGGYLEAEVLALDSAGYIIPAHSLMNLTPHPQANIIEMSYKRTNQRGNAVCNVYGRHVGDTTLRVSAGNIGKEETLIYSPAKPIQVFPPLTLQPKNITLIIGATYQVIKKGGPYPDVVVEFSMENDTIASTSHTGVVTAKSLGITVLTGKAVSFNKQTGEAVVYSKDMVIVNVIPLNKIRIQAPLTYLETGTTMPLYAFGSDDNQNPFSYATAVPPLMFEWSISNKHIASFVGIFKNNGIVEGKENNGIVRIKAEHPGTVTVTLKVKPTHPMTTPNFQIVDNLVMVAKYEFRVFESLRLKYPADSSSSLLLSKQAETKIRTNRDGDAQLSYEVEGCNVDGTKNGNPIVTVSPDGTVRSGSTTGQSTVVVKVKESFGVSQYLTILCEVKKVKYIQTEVEKFMSISSGESITRVPVGANFHLQLSYHDDRGRIFHATSVKPKYRVSRHDLINIHYGSINNTVSVKVQGSGQSVLHIWDEHDEQVYDYLWVNSGSAVTPEKVTVPLGDHVCFLSNVQNIDGSPGVWSTKGDAATVDVVSGVTSTLRVGRSLVSYEISNGFVALAEVSVVPITKIIVGSLTQALSIGHVGVSHFAPISIAGDDTTVQDSFCNPVNPPSTVPPFTCILAFSPSIPEIDVRDIFSAKAVYIPHNGYGCDITSLTGPSLAVATVTSGVIIEAVVVGKGEQGEVRSGQTALVFHAAPVSEISEVKLSNVEPSVTVTLIGTPDVLTNLEIPGVVGDANVVELYLGSPDGNKRPLTLTAKDSAWVADAAESDKVSVFSPLSRSYVEISVQFDVMDGECVVPKSELGILSVLLAVVTHPDRFIVSIISVIVILACIIIGYQALFGTNYRQTRENGVFASSPAPAPPMASLSSGRNATVPVRTQQDPVRQRLSYSISPSPQRVHLWSENAEPIYGGASFRRGAYDGSPTYSGSPK